MMLLPVASPLCIPPLRLNLVLPPLRSYSFVSQHFQLAKHLHIYSCV